MERKSGIYAIRLIGTDKCYVGSSVDIAKRWRDHKYYLSKKKHHSHYMQHAWNKYGAESFEFIVLENVHVINKHSLVDCEQKHMDLLKPCFNFRPSSHSTLGMKYSQETCAKISAANKGRPSPKKGVRMSEEQSAKMQKYYDLQRGKKHSLEHRAKISASLNALGRKWSPEQCAQISARQIGRVMPREGVEKQSAKIRGRVSWFKGKKHSEEVKAKLSAMAQGRPSAFKGKKHTAEAKAKVAASRIGKPLSAETRAKLTGNKRSAEAIAKSVAAHAGSKRSAETRARMSAAQRLRFGSKKKPVSKMQLALQF